MNRRDALKRIAAAGIASTTASGVTVARIGEDCVEPWRDDDCVIDASPTCDAEDCPDKCCSCACE